jgi:hypothetical protein
MNFCDFCHRPCGQRSFCDEVCYDEYQEAMQCFLQGIAEDYPVGNDTGEFEDERSDVVGGL